jgi:hypothetical protein
MNGVSGTGAFTVEEQKKLAAFPWRSKDVVYKGMTLRDYFAAKAMQSFVAMHKDFSIHLEDTKTGRHYFRENSIAAAAYIFADAMIEERNK